MLTIAEILKKDISDEMKDLAIKGLASRPEGYVLAVDFDGTLCWNKYPEIGEERKRATYRVRRVKDLGVKVILWTCREGALLDAALAWCAERGLIFDAVNDNTEERKALYGNNPRKVGYDELWDDRAVSV
mgnify:CR=1 FL=1